MTITEPPLHIVTPVPGQFEAMSRLRTVLFVEEVVDAGLPPDLAAQHVASWDAPESQATVNAVWGNRLEHPDEYHLRIVQRGAKVEGLLIGTVISPDFNGAKYLDVIQLAPSVRRRGLGRKLVEDFIDCNRETDTFLHVYEGNERAQAFYAHLGFAVVERVSEKLQGYPMTTLLMRKTGDNI